jgi:hypothetical protein
MIKSYIEIFRIKTMSGTCFHVISILNLLLSSKWMAGAQNGHEGDQLEVVQLKSDGGLS